MPDMKRMGKGKSKIDLYNRCRALDPPPKYKVQQMFDEYNKANPERDLKMLLLAVAIPQLNPIENMWGRQKQHVRTFNKEYTMSAVKDLVLQKYNQHDATAWGKQVDKMHRFALDQWTADELLLDEEEGEVPLEDMVVDDEEEGGSGDDMDT